MAHGRTRLYLVCYDIADPKRLARVHRYLRDVAVPIQYSIFVLRATPAMLAGYFRDIDGLIDARADDVRAYPLPDRLQVFNLGRQLFPEGVETHGPSAALESLLHPKMAEQWADRRHEVADEVH